MNNTDILIVNLNNLAYTKNCVKDLLAQDASFNLTVIDQASSESGTQEWYNILKKTEWSRPDCSLNIIQNNSQLPLNHIWNSFNEASKLKYQCYLNNDVRITSNFISDGERIFEKEPIVGCVNHATNNLNYTKKTDLSYIISETKFKQGWDFTLRKEAYHPIPKSLLNYCGDDYLYEMLFRNKWKAAIACSSPMIHYQGMSAKFASAGMGRDIAEYKKLGYNNRDLPRHKYSKLKPTFIQFEDAS